jgi:hypothetical protein
MVWFVVVHDEAVRSWRFVDSQMGLTRSRREAAKARARSDFSVFSTSLPTPSCGTTLALISGVMSEPRGLHCHKRVGRSYESIRALLNREPLRLLQRATTSALDHSKSLIAKLRLQVAGVEIDVDVRMLARRIRDQPVGDGTLPVTCVELSWEAKGMPGLFPTMLAELFARPSSANETQLELVGSYWLPLGAVGNAIDAAVGHRIADSVAHRLLTDLVKQMEVELPVDRDWA